jgi:hypothetical protein
MGETGHPVAKALSHISNTPQPEAQKNVMMNANCKEILRENSPNTVGGKKRSMSEVEGYIPTFLT